MTLTAHKFPIRFAALFACLLTGCATTDLQTDSVREIDSERVSVVDRAAKDAGVHVIWINPPTRVRERTVNYSMTVNPKREDE
jgi:hypothetical protein